MGAAGWPPRRGDAAEHRPEVQPAIADDDPGRHQGVLVVSRDNMCHLDSLEGNQDAGAESPSQSEEFK